MKNKRVQSRKTPYLLEIDGKQYGAYEFEDNARSVANSFVRKGIYCVIRRGDEKIWES